MDHMWPHRTLIAAGVPAPGHSDAPICDTNPWPIMGAMVTRRTDTGQPIGRTEAVSFPAALRVYTILGAFAGFEEGSKGSIEPGKLADFAILDRDPFSLPIEAIGDTGVDQTIVAGRVAFER